MVDFPTPLRWRTYTCDICGIAFTPKQPGQKRCSVECAKKAGLYTPTLEKKVFVCDICGAEFTPRTANQKRCSPECSKKAGGLRDLAKPHISVLDKRVRICDICEREFVPKSANQKRCSRRCAEEATAAQGRGRWAIFNRDGFQCIYCGRSSHKDRIRLHADHIIPKSLGGTDTADNLVTTCKRCNLEKSSHLLSKTEIFDEVDKRNKDASLHPKLVIRL